MIFNMCKGTICRTTIAVIGFLTLVALLVWFSIGSPFGASANEDGMAPRPEVVCSDFQHRQSAQNYFDALDAGERLASGLDTNGNGVACEMLIKTKPYLPRDGFDVRCDDFYHRQEADLFFDHYAQSAESDIYGLDRDGDGMPCESLPSEDDFDSVTARFNDRLRRSDQDYAGDRRCRDFESWHDAAAFFVNVGGPASDPHRLDDDRDGIPCESLPGAPSSGH